MRRPEVPGARMVPILFATIFLTLIAIIIYIIVITSPSKSQVLIEMYKADHKYLEGMTFHTIRDTCFAVTGDGNSKSFTVVPDKLCDINKEKE